MNKDIKLTILFFVALIISSFSIVLSFPAEKDYMTTADEGIYFKQAQKINEQGWSGFESLATEYKSNPNLQVYPPPMRIGFIFLASLAFKFSASYHALSMLNLLFFFLQCTASFFFIKRHWGILPALIAGILLCVSPLSMSLARRALSDPCYYLFISLSLFAVIDFIRWQKRNHLIQFIIFFTIAIIVKETALFLLPFFAAVLLFNRYYLEKSYNFSEIILFVCLPVILSGILYLIAFGGIGSVIELFAVTNKINIANPHEYIIRYNSGPWYQYFIDFFLLSPFTSIIFLFYCGYYLFNKDRQNEQMTLLLLFFLYSILAFSFLPKNVRYVQSFDIIYRLCAALFIVDLITKIISSTQVKNLALALIISCLVFTDAKAFYNYNLQFEIYDPISFNLLSAEHFFYGVGEIPLTDTYLNSSYYYYRKGDFKKCIESARQALLFSPGNIAAYNNICASYNEMKDWDNAIEAGKKAVELDPNNQLAKNNLNWAISQKKL